MSPRGLPGRCIAIGLVDGVTEDIVDVLPPLLHLYPIPPFDVLQGSETKIAGNLIMSTRRQVIFCHDGQDGFGLGNAAEQREGLVEVTKYGKSDHHGGDERAVGDHEEPLRNTW